MHVRNLQIPVRAASDIRPHFEKHPTLRSAVVIREGAQSRYAENHDEFNDQNSNEVLVHIYQRARDGTRSKAPVSLQTNPEHSQPVFLLTLVLVALMISSSDIVLPRTPLTLEAPPPPPPPPLFADVMSPAPNAALMLSCGPFGFVTANQTPNTKHQTQTIDAPQG